MTVVETADCAIIRVVPSDYERGYEILEMAKVPFTESDLLDRDTNLRLGFRFLKDMLGQFDQDLHMALVAYNRGPGRVAELITRGEDPANGYAESVLKGVRKGS